MIRYTGINHLAMATHDMDTTIRFWRDLLGMRLIAGLGHPGYRHYFFEHWQEVTRHTPPEEQRVYPGEGISLV